MILGDFNSILVDAERKGGASNPSNRSRQSFTDMIQNSNHMDAAFKGVLILGRKAPCFRD